MQIGIDARITGYNASGISRYCAGLLSALGELDHPPELTVFLSRRKRPGFAPKLRFRSRYLFTPPHNRFETITLPLELKRARCRVLHAIDFFTPVPSGVREIMSVYDLYFLRNPTSLDAASYRHYSRVRAHASSASHIICCSEATRRDVLELTSAPPERVSVIYPGAPEPSAAFDSRATVARYRLDEPFVLSVGTIEPRKNLERLLQAVKRAKQAATSTLPRLVLVGRRGFRADEILASISTLGLERQVVYLGEIPDSDVRALYAAAEFVAYPSLYEGFGFPLLEAMAADTPLLTTRTSSIPEVVGDAALLVEPESVEDLSDGFLTLAREPELRQSLRQRGRARLGKFSWAEVAQRTASIYRDVGADA